MLEETSSLAPDVHDLLLRTVWGTPRHGALYKIADLDFFDTFPELDFHNLRDADGRLLATRYFRRHSIRLGAQRVNAIYHSFSAVQPAMQGKGYGGQLAAASRDNFLQKLGAEGGIIYAYVERANIRNAKNLQKAGYEAVGEFWTGCMAYSTPKHSPHVRALGNDDLPQVRELYKTTYADFAFVDDEETFSGQGYYVLEKCGDILAVLHAESLHWRIERLGFPGDRLILSLMARMPGIRKLFNASDLHFLKLGNLCYRPGAIERLNELIATVLAIQRRHTAMVYLDKKSVLFKELKKTGALGLLNTLTETPVTIYAFFVDLPEPVKHEFHDRLKTFSPYNL